MISRKRGFICIQFRLCFPVRRNIIHFGKMFVTHKQCFVSLILIVQMLSCKASPPIWREPSADTTLEIDSTDPTQCDAPLIDTLTVSPTDRNPAPISVHMEEPSLINPFRVERNIYTASDELNCVYNDLTALQNDQRAGVFVVTLRATSSFDGAVSELKLTFTDLAFEDDIPDAPTDLQYDEALTTGSSIYITWRPGNNGGLPQTFHIKYKKEATNTWNYINVTDTGDTIMYYSITGLCEKTQYDIIIYASNELGDSKESDVHIALTKENKDIETTNIVPVIVYSVGATLGFVILVVLSICLVWRCRSKREANGDTAMSARNVQGQNIVSTIAEAYLDERSASNYDALESVNRDVSTYSTFAASSKDKDQDEVVYESV